MRPRLSPAALIPRRSPGNSSSSSSVPVASSSALPSSSASAHAFSRDATSPLSFLYPPACHVFLRRASSSSAAARAAAAYAHAAYARDEADVHAHDEHVSSALQRREPGTGNFFTRLAPPHPSVAEASAQRRAAGRQHDGQVTAGAPDWEQASELAEGKGKAAAQQPGEMPQGQEAEDAVCLAVRALVAQAKPVKAARLLLQDVARHSRTDAGHAEAQSVAMRQLHSDVLSALSAEIALSDAPAATARSLAAQLFEAGRASAYSEAHYMRSLLARSELLGAIKVLRTMLERGHAGRVLLRDLRAAKRNAPGHDAAVMELGRLCVEGLLPLEQEKAHIARNASTSIGWILRSVARLCSSPDQRTSSAARQLLSDYVARIPREPVAAAPGTERASRAASLPDAYTLNTLVHHLLQKGQPHQVAVDLLQVYMAHRGSLDDVTISVLLRRATVLGNPRLANAALMLGARATRRRQLIAKGRADLAERDGAQLELKQTTSLGSQLRDAVSRGDSWRLVALLAHATATGRFRRADPPPARLSRPRPGTPARDSPPSTLPTQGRLRSAPPPRKQARQIVRILYPSLHKFSQGVRARRTQLAHLQSASPNAAELLPTQPDPACVLHPHVLSAALNLCAKAGRTGLAERVWRLLCQTVGAAASRGGAGELLGESAAQGLAPSLACYVPVQAATSMLQVYAREARKGMPLHLRFPARRGGLQRDVRGPARRQRLARTARRRSKSWARGWTPRSRGFALPRWLAARVSAASMYRHLRAHWQLEQHANAVPAATSARQVLPPRPDARIFDVLLDIFGRRPGMARRSSRHRGRHSSLQVSGSPTLSADSDAPPAPSSWQDVLDDDPKQVALHGAFLPRTLDPFLLLVLADMALLGIPVPPAYRKLVAGGDQLWKASESHSGGAWRVDARLRKRGTDKR